MTFKEFQRHCKTQERKSIKAEQKRYEKALKLYREYTKAMHDLNLHPLDHKELDDYQSAINTRLNQLDERFEDSPLMRFHYESYLQSNQG